jgi:hypothetical protein
LSGQSRRTTGTARQCLTFGLLLAGTAACEHEKELSEIEAQLRPAMTGEAGASTSAPIATGGAGANADPSAPNDGVDSGDVGTAAPAELACSTEQSRCDGTCVDTRSARDHCGRCEHSCQGGECSLGRCQSVTIGLGKGQLFMVAVDDTRVYYGGGSTPLGRIAKDGSADRTLVPRAYTSTWALTPTALVWGNAAGDRGLRACVLPDAPAEWPCSAKRMSPLTAWPIPLPRARCTGR